MECRLLSYSTLHTLRNPAKWEVCRSFTYCPLTESRLKFSPSSIRIGRFCTIDCIVHSIHSLILLAGLTTNPNAWNILL